jgi:hypothetical protein
MKEGKITLPPFNVYYGGCFKIHEGYYCPECGFGSLKYNICNKHGEMQPCWVYDLVLFHPIEGLINALVLDLHLIQDPELLQILRDKDLKDEVAGIISTIMPLLTPLTIYPIDIIPNKFRGYSGDVTLKSVHYTEQPLITNGDGIVEVIDDKYPEKVWNEIKSGEGFNDKKLVVVKRGFTLYVITEKGTCGYKITPGEIRKNMYITGVFSTVPHYVGNVTVPITTVTKIGKDEEYLNAVGMVGNKAYVVVNKFGRFVSCGINIYNDILPPVFNKGEDNDGE